jgi:hypothetical protein
MRSCFFLLLALLFSVCQAQVPDFNTVGFYPGNSSNYIHDVAADADGNRYFTGYFYGTVTFGTEVYTTPGSGCSGFVVKTDSAGNVIWSVHLSSASNVAGYSIALDPSGDVIVGGYCRYGMNVDATAFAPLSTNDIFLLRLTNSGALVWNRQMRGPAVQPTFYACNINDLELDATGNIHFTGFFTDSLVYQGEVLAASGVNDIVVGKLDNDGNLIWMEKAGGNYGGSCGLDNNDNGAGLALDGDGNVYITGHYAFNCAFGGATVLTALNTVDLYLAKYDNAGNFLWARSAGGYTWQVANAVACDAAGNVYVAGHFQYECIFGTDTLISPSTTGNPYDMFLAKYDASGNYLWVRQEGGLNSEYAYKMEIDDADNVYVLGTYEDNSTIGDSIDLQCYSASDTRCFMAKYDDAGNFQYMVHGGGYYNYPYALCLDANNDVVFAGATTAVTWVPIVFGSVVNSTTGIWYLFVTTVDDPFNLVSSDPAAISGGVVLYPNPFSEGALLRFDNPNNTPVSLEILSLQGALISATEPVATEQFALDGSGLAAGMYCYRLVAGSNVLAVGRMVVE